MLGGMLSMALLLKTRDRRKQADANQGWQDCAPAAPLVDILICTYNEEAAILERTIVGALAQTYTNFRVWLLDDGRRPEIAALCGALGCYYLTREDNRHAKAGNINAAIRTLAALNVRPDFVAILDADFVPFPKFVERAMALHKASNVAIVQTPQHFINPDRSRPTSTLRRCGLTSSAFSLTSSWPLETPGTRLFALEPRRSSASSRW